MFLTLSLWENKLIYTIKPWWFSFRNTLILSFKSFLFPQKLFKMLLHLHTLFNMCRLLKTRLNTGYVSQERGPRFIYSQNFYFHFHYKSFCIKAVHLSDKLFLTCPRLWRIEDICIGVTWFECAAHLGKKVVSMQNIFEEFSELLLLLIVV